MPSFPVTSFPASATGRVQDAPTCNSRVIFPISRDVCIELTVFVARAYHCYLSYEKISIGKPQETLLGLFVVLWMFKDAAGLEVLGQALSSAVGVLIPHVKRLFRRVHLWNCTGTCTGLWPSARTAQRDKSRLLLALLDHAQSGSGLRSKLPPTTASTRHASVSHSLIAYTTLML